MLVACRTIWASSSWVHSLGPVRSHTTFFFTLTFITPKLTLNRTLYRAWTMATDIANVTKAMTYDVLAIGAAFPRNGSKVIENEPFKGEPGRLLTVLTRVTQSNAFKLYKIEGSVDDTVELTRHGEMPGCTQVSA